MDVNRGGASRLRRRTTLIVLGVVALAVGAAVLWLIAGNRAAPGAEASRSRPAAAVPAAFARTETWHAQLTATGTLRAVQEVEVAGDLGGIVSAIRFASGEAVRAGQVLVELDASEERARLAGLEASLERARFVLERDRKLAAREFVSESRLDESRTRVEELQAQVKAQRALIDRKQIGAPFAGELGIRRIDRGDYVEPGQPLVSLQSIAPIYVDFSLPEQHYAKVAPGQRVELVTDAAPDRRHAGEIETRSPRVRPDTRRFDVRAVLDNADRTLRPGMYARVAVVLPAAREVVTVPATAIRRSPYGDTVFVIHGPDEGNGGGPALREQDRASGDDPCAATAAAHPACAAKRRFVETGERRGERIAIESGLRSGERVATAGLLKLDDGAPVVVVPPEQPSGGRSPAPAAR